MSVSMGALAKVTGARRTGGVGVRPLDGVAKVDQGPARQVDQWGVGKVDVGMLDKWTLSHIDKVDKRRVG